MHLTNTCSGGALAVALEIVLKRMKIVYISNNGLGKKNIFFMQHEQVPALQRDPYDCTRNSLERKTVVLDVDFSYCWLNLEVKLYSLEQYIGLIEDKLSSTTVDFFRSEGYLETKCLYWIREPKKC